MDKMIKLERRRLTPYFVNYNNNGRLEPYQWTGSKKGQRDIKEVPEYVVNWLLINSVCFKDGELAIVEDTEEAKEIKENIADIVEYENNSHSREEIVSLLTGNFLKMKSELGKITAIGEKQFIINIAKEIKLDSASKRKWLAEWMNVPEDILFSEEKEDKE
jgi:hypothetical protein